MTTIFDGSVWDRREAHLQRCMSLLCEDREVLPYGYADRIYGYHYEPDPEPPCAGDWMSYGRPPLDLIPEPAKQRDYWVIFTEEIEASRFRYRTQVPREARPLAA
jgi:hypothetical protein